MDSVLTSQPASSATAVAAILAKNAYGPSIKRPPVPDQPGKAYLLCLAKLVFGFDKWIFPLINRVQEADLIDQLVAVQPMQQPVGRPLYLDLVYNHESLGPAHQERIFDFVAPVEPQV